MKTLACLFTLFALGVSALADSPRRMKIELTDGSTLYAEPSHATLIVVSDPLKSDLTIPYPQIARLDGKQGRVAVTLLNGDHLTVRFSQKSFICRTVFGEASIPVERIKSIVLEAGSLQAAAEPAQVPQLDYAGLRWDLWRTQWSVNDDRLTAIGKVRPGFKYGHWGRGRGGMVITGNGDQSWRDYEVAFDFQLKPATKKFYHSHIPGETRGMGVFFRAKSMTESWNQPDSGYVIAINPNGSWTIVGYDGWHMPGNGWSSSNRIGKRVKLATGKGEAPLSDGPNRLRLRVVGSTVTVWINDAKLTEFTHQSSAELAPIAYGGFGVQWRYESLGWIGNMEVEKL